MKKSDLKTGMLLECRNGITYLVINDYAINKNQYFDLKSQEYDLTDSNPYFDIMRVSKVLTGADLIPEYWTREVIMENLLWERKPIETIKIAGQEFNKQEVEKALKDLKPIK
jgi:hypothetical protein